MRHKILPCRDPMIFRVLKLVRAGVSRSRRMEFRDLYNHESFYERDPVMCALLCLDRMNMCELRDQIRRFVNGDTSPTPWMLPSGRYIRPFV